MQRLKTLSQKALFIGFGAVMTVVLLILNHFDLIPA